MRDAREPPLAAYRNRASVGASPNGNYGGMRSLMALRQVLELGCGALVLPEQITVFRASEAFDEMDNLKDKRRAKMLKTAAQRLIDMARQFG